MNDTFSVRGDGSRTGSLHLSQSTEPGPRPVGCSGPDEEAMSTVEVLVVKDQMRLVRMEQNTTVHGRIQRQNLKGT